MTDTAPLSPQEMSDALRTWGVERGGAKGIAAAHLLAFTALPGRADFAAYVRVQEWTADDGTPRRGAEVVNWPGLVDRTWPTLSVSDAAMLELAAALVNRRPVNLAKYDRHLGAAYLRRMLEAIALATRQIDALEAIVCEHRHVADAAPLPTDRDVSVHSGTCLRCERPVYEVSVRRADGAGRTRIPWTTGRRED